jgi:cobalt-precorrin 5A hydrolase
VELDEAMIVAGVGCRKGVSETEVLDGIWAATARFGVPRLDALATAELKREEAAILAAAARLGLPVIVVGDEALAAAGPAARTRSERVIELVGAPSVAECAALAAAGEGARLYGARVVTGAVTCAIATDEAVP